MTHALHEAIQNVLTAAEIAADEGAEKPLVYVDAMTSLMSYYEGVIARADKIMDRKKEKVYNDTLALNTRGEMERAMTAYTVDYLLGLDLSLEATSELALQLIELIKRYNLPAPQAWIDVAKFDTSVGVAQNQLKRVRQALDF